LVREEEHAFAGSGGGAEDGARVWIWASRRIGRIHKATFHEPRDAPRRRDGKIPDPGRSGFHVFRPDPAAALIFMSRLEIFGVHENSSPGGVTDGVSENRASQRHRRERFAAREVNLSNLVRREPFSEDDVVTAAVRRAEHAHPRIGADRPAHVRGADLLCAPLARTS
jgi:hypothetical protein